VEVCPQVSSVAIPVIGAVQLYQTSSTHGTQPGFDWPCEPVEASVLSKPKKPVPLITAGVEHSSAGKPGTGRTRNVPVPGEPKGELPSWNTKG
jgi:hypothetical protein